ncbi:MAG: alpha-amylase [Leptolyngbya sp. SIO1D8]|nr:alpha-amylase [Leptolyngbya sp. SIO1D8]
MVPETNLPTIALVEDATQAFLDWAITLLSSIDTPFQLAKILATRLGAHYRSDGLTEIAFWVPEVETDIESSGECYKAAHHHQIKQAERVYLACFTPLQPIDFRASQQVITFQQDRLPLLNYKNFFCGVFSGMHAGTKTQAGTFYWLQYIDDQGNLQTIGDSLAYSLPYGIFAPAELYDINRLQQQRSDLSYFSPAQHTDLAVTKVRPPRNILQLHVSTASPEGTLEGLNHIYQQIAYKQQAQIPLTPAEENYIGYDAVQLLPIEPVVEYPAPNSNGPGFVSLDEATTPDADRVKVHLRKPDTQNWGYDIVLYASSATNPSILGSLRPDELVEFIATLHTFPTGPMQVIYDLVYGHSDNQAKALLNQYFLKGPNMYGQDVNHQHPAVRAILLEMQRRKINTGADGIRVDGAQDFKFLNTLTGKIEYDDAYLKEMSNVRQEIGGHQRQLVAIFEDGRPWPADGWEESSTYLDVIKQQPEAYQWGPLIFAHNTPSLKRFWDRKWHRVCEVMANGSQWISGCANHDTMRRGTQLDHQSDINWNLGKTLPEVINNAYDNPAVTLLFHGFSPGLPMDFLNATMRAPWCFFRNTDDFYGLKVIAEEVGFLDWQVEPEFYDKSWAFNRLKQLEIQSFEDLRLLMNWLQKTVSDMEDNYDLETLAHLAQTFLQTELDNPPKITVQTLKAFAKAYMEDCNDLCNVTHFSATLDPRQTCFNLSVRHYRHSHAWLRKNLTGQDYLSRFRDDQKTIFYGLRTHAIEGESDFSEKVAIVAHMGGSLINLNLEELLSVDLTQWHVAIATPGLNTSNLRNLELQDSQGLLLESI